MLGKASDSKLHLLIPELRYMGIEVPLKSGKSTSKLNFYVLGWDAVDHHKRSEYASWALKYWGRRVDFLPETLPPQFDAVVKHIRFAVPSSYRDEIIRCTTSFYVEWLRERPFDTMIREMCLAPAIASINVAFKLLFDCAYDTTTAEWLREVTLPGGLVLDRWMLRTLAMYKFWRESTGRGLVWDHAELPKLERYADVLEGRKHKPGLESDLLGEDGAGRAANIRQLLGIIRAWEAEQERLWEFCTAGGEQTVAEEGVPAKRRRKRRAARDGSGEEGSGGQDSAS